MFQELCSAVPMYIYYTFSIVLSLVSKSSPSLYHHSPVANNTDCKVIHLRPWLFDVYDVVEGKGKGNSCNYITRNSSSQHHFHDKDMSILVKFIKFIVYKGFTHCHYFGYLGELAGLIVTTWQNSRPKKSQNWGGIPQNWVRKWV